MFDDAAGRAFAAFVLALLPRLLLYPGGLFALLIAGGLPFLTRSRRKTAAGAPLPALSEASAVLAPALAWAGLALLPLPGLAPLPSGPDLLAPLGLLLGASWLLLPAPGSADRRALGGYGLLLLSPLLALAQSPAGSLLLLPAPTTPVSGGIRWLIMLSFSLGLGVIYTLPVPNNFISQLAIHIPKIGFIGMGLIISPVVVPSAPFWVGSLLLGGLTGIVGWVCGLPQAQRWADWSVPVGWAALGLALVGVLGQGW